MYRHVKSEDIHSVIFGTKNTWDDWKLIPSSRPVINPPAPKTMYVDIPGGDGQLDLSTVLTGDIAYSQREGSLEFVVDNGHKAWYDRYSEIMNYLHGKSMRLVLEDDPYHYYEGRFSVNSWASNADYSNITIDYNVKPYKYEQNTSLEDWLWDSFDFEIGVVREYKDIVINKSLRVAIIGGPMKVTPKFHVRLKDPDVPIYVRLDDEETAYSLTEGVNRIITLQIPDGEHSLLFTGNGTVSIEYRGGRL